MTVVLIRSLIIYVIIISSVRLMGKRQLGELQPTELVITMILSNIATLTLEDVNMPLIAGVLPIFAIVCYEVLMSWLMLKSTKFRQVAAGKPIVIISGGGIDKAAMKTLRLSQDDLQTAMRQSGIFSLDDVEFAIVETTGKISFKEKGQLNGKN